MDETLSEMRERVQDALDELLSPRSSSDSKTMALQTLERQLALACVSKDTFESRDSLLALQYTFECNVPSRLLAWIAPSTVKLEQLTNKDTMELEREAEAYKLASQLSLALSLMQGIALIHEPSKGYLGRKYPLEVLLDLLLASRHLSTPSETSASGSRSKSAASSLPLTSIVLDTLLCILVDSSTALRAFEDAKGTQAIVKILKRAGTPREVRMKCLEFLYFYLLDETLLPDGNSAVKVSQTAHPPTQPATPVRPLKPSINATPLRPSSRYGSSTFTFPSTTSSSSSSSSSRSASGSSTNSFSSISSNASSSTTASSVSSSPEKASAPTPPPPRTPPSSPPLGYRPPPLQVRSMMMLKKEVDYVPLSPKKSQISRLGSGVMSRHTPGKSLSGSRSRLGSAESVVGESEQSSMSYIEVPGKENERRMLRTIAREEKKRTTEEKKELLGTMLGNVDALVEGVRKAGIWGLG